jgi:hypothetical protein
MTFKIGDDVVYQSPYSGGAFPAKVTAVTDGMFANGDEVLFIDIDVDIGSSEPWPMKSVRVSSGYVTAAKK